MSPSTLRPRPATERYYLLLVARQAPLFAGEQASQALVTVRAELDNIRAAWSWTLAHGAAPLIEAATGGLAAFYEFAGLYHEGAAAFRRAAAQATGAAAGSLRGRLRLQQSSVRGETGALR